MRGDTVGSVVAGRRPGPPASSSWGYHQVSEPPPLMYSAVLLTSRGVDSVDTQNDSVQMYWTRLGAWEGVLRRVRAPAMH